MGRGIYQSNTKAVTLGYIWAKQQAWLSVAPLIALESTLGGGARGNGAGRGCRGRGHGRTTGHGYRYAVRQQGKTDKGQRPTRAGDMLDSQHQLKHPAPEQVAPVSHGCELERLQHAAPRPHRQGHGQRVVAALRVVHGLGGRTDKKGLGLSLIQF